MPSKNKNNRLIDFGNFFLCHFFNSNNPLTYREIKDQAEKLGISDVGLFAALRISYQPVFKWVTDQRMIILDEGIIFDDLLEHINILRREAKLKPIAENEIKNLCREGNTGGSVER